MSELPDQAPLRQHQQLRDMARGYRQAQVLLTCVEPGDFETLARGATTAAEVAVAV